MHEYIAPTIYYWQVHLLYASLACIAAWVLTSFMHGSATIKYWIWVVASVNFVVPLGGIIDRFGATHLSWARSMSMFHDADLGISRSATAAAAVVGVWLLGALLMIFRLVARIRAERHAACATGFPAGHEFLAHGVPVRFAEARQVPAVAGVLRPHISLPQGIQELLSESELEAVLMHEATHARRRDNLLRLLHELGLCALWFHPLVWVVGSRLALYRELSCDENVIQRAHGAELISALAKLADPRDPFVLRATASSFIGERLSCLTAEPSGGRGADALLATLFGLLVAAGVVLTIAHTACCFPVG